MSWRPKARRVQPEGPYHLGGFSFGGLVAYEAARLLIEDGEKVAFLGVVDSRPQLSAHRRLGLASACAGDGGGCKRRWQEPPIS